jgi:hypothetical protein
MTASRRWRFGLVSVAAPVSGTGGLTMTEQEWQQSTDPKAMLQFLAKRKSRKYRLAAVAACELFPDTLDERTREALAVAERFADDRATEAELKTASANADAVVERRWQEYCALDTNDDNGDDKARDANELHAVAEAVRKAVSGEPEEAFFHLSFLDGREFFFANILRDVFGPQTAVSFNPAWLTPAVTALAHSIYEESAFNEMPVLADALEDAGCTDEAILTHCRRVDDLAPHVRGCWVLDWIGRPAVE